MLDYTLTINGVDFSGMIERDSYSTGRVPVFSDTVTTMDGVDHVALVRHKGTIRFEFNPQTAAQTATAFQALMAQPCTVYYFCLQTNAYRQATMLLSEMSAAYLSRCLSRGLRWNQIDEIELTEL